MTIHGIFTRGKWQKEISPLLAGYIHHPVDFGYFWPWRLYFERSRRKVIKLFLEEYTKAKARDPRPFIIAHSFGTYVVARALAKHPEIELDRIIFCGSIVDVGFGWSTRVNQFNALLNDCGKKDRWSKLSPFIVADGGPSGVVGFSDIAEGAVLNHINPQFEHSDYFYDLNYQQRWLPFLHGREPKAPTKEDKRAFNWRAFVFRWLLRLIVLILCWYLYSWAACRDWPWDSGPATPPPEPEIRQQDLPTREAAMAAPKMRPEDVRLTILNETGQNLQVWMYATEFAFDKPSQSSGFHTMYVFAHKDANVTEFPGNHGLHLFYALAKCDNEPRLIGQHDVFEGTRPVVHIKTDDNGGDTTELTFGAETTK